MPHFEVSALQHVLDLVGQFEQSDQVGHRRARAAHGRGDLLVGQFELLAEALQRLRLFQGIEIFALDVFDQGDRGR